MGENIINAFDQNLRQAGFIKKGDSWYFSGTETTLVANLQKSNYGNQYYVNLAVYVKQFGEEQFPKEHKCHIRMRLDALVTDGTERTFNADDLSVPEEEGRNAVAQVMQGIQTVNYTYNAANQRISKIVTNGSGTVVTNQRYVYDGSNLLAVLNVNPATGVPTVAQRFMTQDAGVLAQENASGTGQAGVVSWGITDNTSSVVDAVANGGGNRASRCSRDRSIESRGLGSRFGGQIANFLFG